MSYRLEPLGPTGQSVRHIAAAQIDELIGKFGEEPLSATGIHETRKALKRLRALLTLVRHGLAGDDLRREKDRLRAIARSLAGVRDAHVMMATAAGLENEAMPRACRPAGRALVKLLQVRRKEAEGRVSQEPLRLPLADLRKAQSGLEALPFDELTFADVLHGLTDAYRRGRRLAGYVFRADTEDERFHDLRKHVQQHWRHLQLLSNAWPKGLRPQIALARELSETLGQDHDIALLAELARERETAEPGKRFDVYAQFCAVEQMKLRCRAELLARRLYAEKPKALRRRIKSYWGTAVERARQNQPSVKATRVLLDADSCANI